MPQAPAQDQVAALGAAIYRDGAVGLPGALGSAWGRQLAEDFAALFAEARARPGGTVSRGPQRHYFAVHAERLRGLLDLVTNPWVTRLSEHLLGPDYRFVEVAFDVPLPGAMDQPWHRDFPMPPETRDEHRLSSLAFNATAVDVTPEMGPFEVAPGTHWDTGDDFEHGMFPARADWPRFEARAERKLPHLGDLAARTGLTVHRGTANRSTVTRPVLVLGVVAPEVETDVHGLMLSRSWHDALPSDLRRHLRCTVVDELRPLEQRHTIEGLVMGVL